MAYVHILPLLVALWAFSPACWSCGVANWHPMTVAKQAAEASIVVYGRITAHYPMPDVPLDRAYIAEMDIACNLKGEALPVRVNIAKAGELTSCHHTLLPVGEEFITFLIRDSGNIIPHEVNYLSVAFPPTDENVRQVRQAVANFDEKCPQLRDGGRGDGDNGASGVTVSVVCHVAMVTLAWLWSTF